MLHKVLILLTSPYESRSCSFKRVLPQTRPSTASVHFEKFDRPAVVWWLLVSLMHITICTLSLSVSSSAMLLIEATASYIHVSIVGHFCSRVHSESFLLPGLADGKLLSIIISHCHKKKKHALTKSLLCFLIQRYDVSEGRQSSD